MTNHSANVLAIQVQDIYDTVVPGAFEIQEEKRIAFICPCGCGDRFVLPFFGRGWSWDGNKDLPTLTPSIRQLRGCKWHGHLVAGVWQPVGDSGL